MCYIESMWRRGGGVVLLFWFQSVALVRAQVVINEFLPNPPVGENEWVELYNSSSEQVSLTDLILTDSANHDQALSSLGSIPPTSFAVYEYPKGDGWLNNDHGDSIYLKHASEVLDQYSYAADPGENVTFGRFPDGLGEFVVLSHASRGLANSAPISPTLTPPPIATHTSKPTATPKPTPSPKPSPLPSPSEHPWLNFDPITPASSGTTSPAASHSLTATQAPGSVLALTASPPVPSNLSSPSTTPSRPSWPALLFISLGSISFLTSCVLFFRKLRSNEKITKWLN